MDILIPVFEEVIHPLIAAACTIPRAFLFTAYAEWAAVLSELVELLAVFPDLRPCVYAEVGILRAMRLAGIMAA